MGDNRLERRDTRYERHETRDWSGDTGDVRQARNEMGKGRRQGMGTGDAKPQKLSLFFILFDKK